MPGKACLSACLVTLLAYSKLEARGLIEELLKEYNQMRPHSTPSYRPPVPEIGIPVTIALQVVSFMRPGHLIDIVFSELGDALSPRREPGDEGSF